MLLDDYFPRNICMTCGGMTWSLISCSLRRSYNGFAILPKFTRCRLKIPLVLISVKLHRYCGVVLLGSSSLATHDLELNNIFLIKQYDLKKLPVSEKKIFFMFIPFRAVFSKLVLYAVDVPQTSLNKLGYHPDIAQQANLDSHTDRFI